MYAFRPVHHVPIPLVDFPRRWLVGLMIKLGLACFAIMGALCLTVFQEYEYSNKTKYLSPCNSSISIENLNDLSKKINSTAKEIESISTVLKKIKINIKHPAVKQLSAKYANLIEQSKVMGEKWLIHKNEYYECYKINTLKAFYRTPGYFIMTYYILITIVAAILITLLQKIINSYDLTQEQMEVVKELYGITKGLWALHLGLSPLFVWNFFYSDDISNFLKKRFPIYPRFFDVNYIL